MRRLILLPVLLVGALGAETPLRIVGVERRGPPPFEGVDRVYRLDGGKDRGLRPGLRLAVCRPGLARPLGHLRLTEVREAEAEGRFETAEGAFPLKGDQVRRVDLRGLPAFPALEEALPVPAPPGAPMGAPPQEGLLFFLPQQTELSPAGQKKLEAWVAAWGMGGRWVVQVPASRGLRPELQKRRAEALQAALKALGVGAAQVESGPRTAEGRHDPAWVRHWD